VRRTLGAGPREILRLILGECLTLTGVRIALGFALTVAAGLGMRPLLFDVSPFDPITLMGSAARVEPRAALED
jgi:ABC-type antimicrobial peptide transport system permease subunit